MLALPGVTLYDISMSTAAQRPVSVGDYNTPVQRLDQALHHLRSLSSTQSAGERFHNQRCDVHLVVWYVLF